MPQSAINGTDKGDPTFVGPPNLRHIYEQLIRFRGSGPTPKDLPTRRAAIL